MQPIQEFATGPPQQWRAYLLRNSASTFRIKQPSSYSFRVVSARHVMGTEWHKDVRAPQVAVTHPEGHRFYFEFPEGWDGGHVPRFHPVSWADNLPPANSWIEAEAAIEAVTAARAQGWVYKR